jgi:hypothetical protein
MWLVQNNLMMSSTQNLVQTTLSRREIYNYINKIKRGERFIFIEGHLMEVMFHFTRAVRFQKFYLGSGFGFFGTEKPRFGFGYFQKRRTVQMFELIYVCFEHFY